MSKTNPPKLLLSSFVLSASTMEHQAWYLRGFCLLSETLLVKTKSIGDNFCVRDVGLYLHLISALWPDLLSWLGCIVFSEFYTLWFSC